MRANPNTRKITTLAMLAAISLVLVTIIRVPMFLPFLEYDPADIPILVATFLYGPLAGLMMTVVVSVIQGLTVSAGSGIIGIAMHIFATGSCVLVAGFVYRKRKTKRQAMLALTLGSLSMVAVMALWNIIFTPIFMGIPREAVVGLLVPAILPFNMIKAGINSVMTFLIYKPVSLRLANQQEEEGRPTRIDNA